MREYFERRAEGEGRKRLARDFDARGIQTVRGKPWNTSTLVSIEDNLEVYLGNTIWNRTSRGYPEKPEPDHIVVESTHEPLITPELADAVRSRRRRSSWKGVQQEYALSGGSLRCGHCGAQFRGTQGYYRCKDRTYKGTDYCPNASIKASSLEAGVAQLVREAYDEDLIEALVRKHPKQVSIPEDTKRKSGKSPA